MIYICIPAHNEERTVGVLLWKVRQVMASFPRDYQILVANDGSTDKTAEVLAPYQRVLPLTVVATQQRYGYATALELLVREAVRRAEYPKRDIVVTLQADFTDDPDELLGLLKRIEAGADIVAANAELPATASRASRWSRKLGNVLLKRRPWPEGVRDPLSGLRAYRVIVLRRALEARPNGRLLTWDGWAANAELLHLAMPHSRRTDAVDYVCRNDRQQRASRQALWPLVRSLFRFARGTEGPLAGEALPVPNTIDLRDRERSRRGPAREARPRTPDRASKSRNGQEPGRTRGARDRATDRSGRPDRPARGRQPPGERPGRPEREARQPRSGAAARKARRVRGDRATPVAEGNGAAPPDELLEEVTAEPATPAKRRRRRRRRGGAGRAPRATGAVAAAETDLESEGGEGSPAPAEMDGDAEASGGNGAEGTAPKKRRSRRGGRGRRGRGRARGAPNPSTRDEAGAEEAREPMESERAEPAPGPDAQRGS